jgi:tight adherence protein B
MNVRMYTWLRRAVVAMLSVFVSIGASGALMASPASAQSAATGTAASTPAGAAKTDPKIDVFIAIDNSSQLPSAQYQASQLAALTLIDALPATTRVGVISFGNFPQKIQLTSPDHNLAKQAVSVLVQEDGNSQLFSGIGLAAESFDETTEASRVVVVVSDGQDGSSAQNIESGKRSAALRKVRIVVIDSTNSATLDPIKSARIAQLAGSTTATKMNDKVAIASLADRLVSEAAPPQKLALSAPEVGLASRIFSSTIVLALAALLLGGALFFAGVQVLGPKEVKVNLTGIPEAPKKAKDMKTPMAGLASKLTDMADKKLQSNEKSSGMQSWLERAAINLRSGEFLILAIVASLVLAALGAVLVSKFWAPVGLLVGAFGSRFVVSRKANKRSRKFGDQLSDTLQLLSSSMRAGQGFMQALDAVAKEADSPTAEEFRRVVVETRLGRDLVDSMKALAERIRCVDLEWVIPAVEINRDVGGDLAEVLEQVGTTIRDRADLRRQVKTLSAEGRLSAVVLIGMPITLGIFINLSNPEYMHVLFSGVGLYMLGAAGILMLIGSIWLFNICKIEF